MTEMVFQATEFTSWTVYTGTKIYLILLPSLFNLNVSLGWLREGLVDFGCLGIFANMLPVLFSYYLLLLQILFFGPNCIVAML